MTALIRACAALSLFSAGSALAQSASLTWQVSADGGQSWNQSVDVMPGTSVRVRAQVAWNSPNWFAFAMINFDGIVLNAAQDDSVIAVECPNPFNGLTQSLEATRYQGGIKIDESSDAALPGAGTQWIHPAQNLDTGPGGPRYSLDNPVVPFTYTFNAMSQMGTRTISAVLNPSTGRAMKVFLGLSGGTINFSANQVTLNTATITVIPAPAAAALIPFAGVLACRRRR